MSDKKVTIVIPVYNAEAYLKKCIYSVLSQSYQNIELVLVDDGSTDKSLFVCKTLAMENSCIKVLHQKNNGVTAARKIGVEASSGDFISFVDADDSLDKDAIEVLVKNMTSEVDFVISNSKFVKKIVDGKDLVDLFLRRLLPTNLWGCLFRKEFLLKSGCLNFSRSITIGEDYLSVVLMGIKARGANCIPEQIYNYTYNPLSAIHTRKVTLQYEEMFRSCMKKILGDKISDFKQSWNQFQLRMINNLVIHKIKVSDIDWVINLRSQKYKSTSLNEWLILHIHNDKKLHWFLIQSRRIYWIKCKCHKLWQLLLNGHR